ncbi:WD40 repeat-like protein [Patellaria atrata CBS 101060]|uniref:Autophagy-related protein 18 n=1 Tax=Patellaria atrata CBS 101060 TaxID=1346257 RepID=A0A9P4SB74_9PEZI|nr:WD40 repeat-like protein [Patellaria atrata CBS 101060]
MNFVTFNQDNSMLGVGTNKGFRLFYTDQFSKCYENRDGDISILEMLFSTSLVAMILSPRLLRIQNTKRQSTICELTFPARVLAVRMNRKRLVVILEDAIYIYDISNMNMLSTVETSPNPHAICALSPSNEHNYLVYPLPQKTAPSAFAPPSHAPPSGSHVSPTTGEVLIFDATKLEAVNVVEAHQTPLSCIALNNEGTLLATASEKGTIIRVFSVPDAQKLYQFRRGSIPARIYCMSFNATSTLLCVSSATETVHIFRLITPNAGSHSRSNSTSSAQRPESSNSRTRDRSLSPGSEDQDDSAGLGDSMITPSGERKQSNPTLASMIRRTSQNVGMGFAAKLGGYLPSAVQEIWEPARDFAWVRVPKSANASSGALKTAVAMSANGPQVMVVTSEGQFYVFTIDLDKGGEGVLTDQYS